MLTRACLSNLLPDCAMMNHLFIGRFMVPRDHVCHDQATGRTTDQPHPSDSDAGGVPPASLSEG